MINKNKTILFYLIGHFVPDQTIHIRMKQNPRWNKIQTEIQKTKRNENQIVANQRIVQYFKSKHNNDEFTGNQFRTFFHFETFYFPFILFYSRE